ncbi:unnamed protein product [Closterium sp. Yama58-4]|nr:unnamed protein product [Closterium sp. Yama58-4]
MIAPRIASRAARRVLRASGVPRIAPSASDPTSLVDVSRVAPSAADLADVADVSRVVDVSRMARMPQSAADLAGVRPISAARACSSALLASPVPAAGILPSTLMSPLTGSTRLVSSSPLTPLTPLTLIASSGLLAPSTRLTLSGPLTRLTQTRGSQFASGFSMPQPKRLEEIMSLDALRACAPEEIAATWNNHHLGRTHVSTVISAAAFETLQHRARVCPMFVLPVARSKGFVTMLAQAQMPHLLFTGLEDFKVRGPSASPFFTVTHYPDLAAEKGVVLVRGDVVLPSKLNDEEAQTLLKDLHSFYTQDSRYRHVEAFNKRPDEFDYRAVVRALGIVASGW